MFIYLLLRTMVIKTETKSNELNIHENYDYVCLFTSHLEK